MPISSEISLVDRLTGLESAYRGLADAVAFDERLADTREYVTNQIAEIILSDELAAEIEGLPERMSRAPAGQTVNELCCDVFGSEDWSCDWTTHRQWLGDAIVAASQMQLT